MAFIALSSSNAFMPSQRAWYSSCASLLRGRPARASCNTGRKVHDCRGPLIQQGEQRKGLPEPKQPHPEG
eukprot:11640352-Alexandrium_andersonii.AAC.1